jgi:dihydrofolate reductase
MRRVVVSMMVSLDGFIEGPNRELDWTSEDPAFVRYCEDMLAKTGAILLGRVSYEMMIGYWPAAADNPDSSPSDRLLAGYMNGLPKLVLSRTVTRSDWNDTRFAGDDFGSEVETLKRQPGKDIMVFGGAGVIARLGELGLIDEYRLIVHPTVLGSGTPLFKDVKTRFRLEQAQVAALGPNLVYSVYRPLPA